MRVGMVMDPAQRLLLAAKEVLELRGLVLDRAFVGDLKAIAAHEIAPVDNRPRPFLEGCRKVGRPDRPAVDRS